MIIELDLKLEKSIKSWRNTPYRHMGRQKGICVDCGGFVMLALRDAGILNFVDEKRYYSSNWFRFTDDEFLKNIIIEHFKKWSDYKIVEIEDKRSLQKHDILLFNHPAIVPACHAAFFVDKRNMVHCYQNSQVKSTNFIFWEKRLKYVLRIL